MMESTRNSQSMRIGDRVYARLTMCGNTIAEITGDRFAGVTDVITFLRHKASRVRGLTSLYVRNQSQGWSVERPLMLYTRSAPGAPLQGRDSACATRPASLFSPSCGIPRPEMQFPWTL